MALEERTRGEEILIRLNQDGVSGAHYQTITEILRDDVVIGATLNPPVALSLIEGQGALSLNGLLGEVADQALSQLEEARAAIAGLSATISAAHDEIEALNQRVAELEAASQPEITE